LCAWHLPIISPYLYHLLHEDMIKSGPCIVDTVYKKLARTYLLSNRTPHFQTGSPHRRMWWQLRATNHHHKPGSTANNNIKCEFRSYYNRVSGMWKCLLPACKPTQTHVSQHQDYINVLIISIKVVEHARFEVFMAVTMKNAIIAWGNFRLNMSW
jgi:hypothetical protein